MHVVLTRREGELRVRGLRAAGAFIMPCVPSANTSAAVFLIAERAADMIAGRPSLAAQAFGAAVTRRADDPGRCRLTRLDGS